MTGSTDVSRWTGFVLVGLVLAWAGTSRFLGPEMVPSPAATLWAMGDLVVKRAFVPDFTITLLRASAALLTALVLALVTGIAAGLSPRTMAICSPLVAVLQSTPPILWITLLMVWAGTGSLVPYLVVVASLYPPLFAVVAQGTAQLPRAWFDTCRVHRVSPMAILFHVILPGIFPALLGGFTYALGTCWKTAAVAEFLGSSTGIGARIYWAYRMLEMETLFAWGAILVGMGLLLDFGVVRPLRKKARTMKGEGR